MNEFEIFFEKALREERQRVEAAAEAERLEREAARLRGEERYFAGRRDAIKEIGGELATLRGSLPSNTQQEDKPAADPSPIADTPVEFLGLTFGAVRNQRISYRGRSCQFTPRSYEVLREIAAAEGEKDRFELFSDVTGRRRNDPELLKSILKNVRRELRENYFPFTVSVLNRSVRLQSTVLSDKEKPDISAEPESPPP